MKSPIETYLGLKIVQSNFLPKIQTLELSEIVMVTDDFRSSFNLFLKDMFGEQEQMLMMNGYVFMSPNSYQLLVKEIYKSNLGVPKC